MRKYSKFLTKEDAQLFRQTIGKVKPLTHSKKIHLQKTITKQNDGKMNNATPIVNENQTSITYDLKLDDPTEYRFSGEETLFFSRPGVNSKNLRQLKRRKYQLDATIDLHGNTIDQARQSLIDFIYNCYQQGYQWLLVIHGKGISSQQQKPILKNHVAAWLMQMPKVLAYKSALPQHGGTGAVVVLLKKQR